MILAMRNTSWLLQMSDPAGANFASLPRPIRSGHSLDDLLGRADAHGVLPAVLRNLRDLARSRGAESILQARPSGTPSNESLELFEKCLQSAGDLLRKRTAVCMLLRRQADQLTAALGECVPVVVLKGPTFADRLYPHPALRTFTDVDLLVKPCDVEAADEIIRQLGYSHKDSQMKYAEGYGERGYLAVGPAGGAVELHWNLVNSPSLRRGISVEYDDLHIASQAQALSPASLLLIAAVHAAASHSFDRLQLLWDVCLAARGAAGKIDEDWLADAAKRTGASLAVAAALDLAARVLSEPQCNALANRLGLVRNFKPWRLLLTRGVILRGHAWRDSFRRCGFRVMLKRRS